MYKKAKMKLILFRWMSVLGFLCAFLCVGSLLFSSYLTKEAYKSFVSISPASEEELRSSTYLRAIRLQPNELTAYIKLLSLYNEDGIFSKKESESFLAMYNNHHTAFDESEGDYATLHSMAGLLYINGYENDSSTIRLRMALPFMEEAMNYMNENDSSYFAISSYCRIGQYYRDYIWDASATIREVSPALMEALTTDIQKTLEQFQKNDSPDALFNRLGYSVAVCNLIYDQRDTLAATVPLSKMTGILDLIYSDLPSPDTLQKEQTQILVKNLQSGESHYREMLERAYQRKGDS